jgi:hypothetical protein
LADVARQINGSGENEVGFHLPKTSDPDLKGPQAGDFLLRNDETGGAEPKGFGDAAGDEAS